MFGLSSQPAFVHHPQRVVVSMLEFVAVEATATLLGSSGVCSTGRNRSDRFGEVQSRGGDS
jgi:hypothetical protein